MWALGINRKVRRRCMILQKDKTKKEECRETPCSYRTWKAGKLVVKTLKKMDNSNLEEVNVHVK